MCDLHSNLGLKSNIILESQSKEIGWYIPFDLKSEEYSYTVNQKYLSEKQKLESIKKLFEAKRTVISNEKNVNNKSECETCKYREICF